MYRELPLYVFIRNSILLTFLFVIISAIVIEYRKGHSNNSFKIESRFFSQKLDITHTTNALQYQTTAPSQLQKSYSIYSPALNNQGNPIITSSFIQFQQPVLISKSIKL